MTDKTKEQIFLSKRFKNFITNTQKSTAEADGNYLFTLRLCLAFNISNKSSYDILTESHNIIYFTNIFLV
jgi:hypothetical protein